MGLGLHSQEAGVMEHHHHHHFAGYGEQGGLFRGGSGGDVHGAGSGSTARVESRAKARERARERAKEKQVTERDSPVVARPVTSYGAHGHTHPHPHGHPHPHPHPQAQAQGHTHVPSSVVSVSAGGQHQHHHLAAQAQAVYGHFPAQVSSALQHPFQASPFQAGINAPLRSPPAASPSHYHVPSYAFPEPSSFVASPYEGHFHPAPGSSYNAQQEQQVVSVSHYFAENPPGSSLSRYQQPGGPAPAFLGLSPGHPPAGSSLRTNSFSSLLADQQPLGYNVGSSFTGQGYYFQTPSGNLRLPQGSMVYTHPGSSHLGERTGQGQGQGQGHDHVHGTHHSLDPNFYSPAQMPGTLQGLEELEEEFKP